ncbi:MAG TPA: hypothetical protein VM943_09305 [Pyrinomonadaceae bacterium]|nr:hypothetical protein [Pyrinomonadaceae bacterium]
MSKKSFGLVAAAVVIIASVIIGGVIGAPSLKVFSASAGNDRNAFIEDAYTEAVSVVASNYVDEID